MTKTTETEVTATPATDKVADKPAKTAKVKDATTPQPDTTDTAATGKKPATEQASYLAVAMTPATRAKIDDLAKAEGVSSAAIVRKAINGMIGGQDATAAATNGKVDAVTAGLDVALAKLKLLDKAIDSALADCVRVADRLARATSDKA